MTVAAAIYRAAAPSRNTVAGTDRSARDRSPAGQRVMDLFAGQNILPDDLDALFIVFHLLNIQRTANQLQIRQADKEDRISITAGDLCAVTGHSDITRKGKLIIEILLCEERTVSKLSQFDRKIRREDSDRPVRRHGCLMVIMFPETVPDQSAAGQ